MVVRVVVRVVERALGVAPSLVDIQHPFSAAAYFIGDSRLRRFVAEKTDEFLCTSPGRSVCILLRDFRFKLLSLKEELKAPVTIIRLTNFTMFTVLTLKQC